MLIDRTHRWWFIITALLFIVSTLAYVVYSMNAPNGPSGGSIMGLIFGIAGTIMMVFAGFLAARKRVPTWHIGSSRFWLQGHLWLGALSFPLILYHAGFGWGGIVENLLWITFTVVWVSGFFGLAMQHIVPRFLTSRVPLETFRSQVPYQSQRNLILADKSVSSQCGALDVSHDALQRQFGRVVSFLDKAEKDDRGNWHQKVKKSVRPMLLDLAKCAKQQNWIRAETDFDVFIKDLYSRFAPDVTAETKTNKTEAVAVDQPKLSPLELAKPDADRTQPVLEKPDGEFINIHQEVKSIQDILIGKYGYRAEVAIDYAERTRPFLESQLKGETAAQEEAASETAATAPAPATEVVAIPTEIPDEPGPERTAAVLATIRGEGAFGSGGTGAAAAPAAPAAAAEPSGPIVDVESVRKGTTKKPTGSKPERVDVVPALRLKELKDFYLKDVRPFLNTNGEYVGNLASKTESNRVFGQMRKVLPVSLHDTVQQLEDFCEERRQFAHQKRLHGWLHSWLMLHIPFTIALYVFMVAHIIIALRVVPWSLAELKGLFGQ